MCCVQDNRGYNFYLFCWHIITISTHARNSQRPIHGIMTYPVADNNNVLIILNMCMQYKPPRSVFRRGGGSVNQKMAKITPSRGLFPNSSLHGGAIQKMYKRLRRKMAQLKHQPGEAVKWGETRKKWLSLLVDFSEIPPLGLRSILSKVTEPVRGSI